VNLSDEEIIEIIKNDKKTDLFSILFDRYSKKVYHTCLSMVNSTDIAEDLSHDIFLKVFLSLQKYDGKASFSTWLYRITSNFCIDYIRKNKRLSNKIEDYTYEMESRSEEDNEKELLSSKAELLKIILNGLDPEDKMILLMKYQEDMSIKNIMQVFNISESATKMRLKRAKAKAINLKTVLNKGNG
jgi:RNA polymerase sigma-70 factor (ECF subfamily)